MPFELGLFIGAKEYGSRKQKEKNCIILDYEPYRYQKFLSDISGHDIKAHYGDVEVAINETREWLRGFDLRHSIPHGRIIFEQYKMFQEDLPEICEQKNLMSAQQDLNFLDFVQVVFE